MVVLAGNKIEFTPNTLSFWTQELFSELHTQLYNIQFPYKHCKYVN